MDEIEVALLSGQSVRQCVQEGETVEHLRREVSKKFGVHYAQLQLMLEGCELPDEQSAAELAGVRVSAIILPPWRAIGGSQSGNLHIWDLEALQCVGTLEESQRVDAVSVDFNSQRAIGACSDRSLGLWDLEEMEQLKYCGGIPRQYAICADFTAQRAVSAGEEKYLHLWDLEAMRPISESCCRGVVLAIKADFTRNRAVIASRDSAMEVWDLESMESVGSLNGHRDSVLCLSVNFELQVAVSGSRDKKVGVWDLQKLANVYFLTGHESGVTALSANFKAMRIVTGSTDATLRVWRMGDMNGECISVLRMDKLSQAQPWMLYDQAITAVTTDFAGRRAASTSHDGVLRLWDLSTSQIIEELPGNGSITSMVSNFDD